MDSLEYLKMTQCPPLLFVDVWALWNHLTLSRVATEAGVDHCRITGRLESLFYPIQFLRAVQPFGTIHNGWLEVSVIIHRLLGIHQRHWSTRSLWSYSEPFGHLAQYGTAGWRFHPSLTIFYWSNWSFRSLRSYSELFGHSASSGAFSIARAIARTLLRPRTYLTILGTDLSGIKERGIQ